MDCVRGISGTRGCDRIGSVASAELLHNHAWNGPMDEQPTPEQLVGLGFRGWMAGYDHGDISCWEEVWNKYATALGPRIAKTAVAGLGCWVRQVRQSSCRRIETYPLGCAGFCRDECIAISIIAASQNDHCPALKACAFALIGSSEINPMLDHASDFASQLRAADQLLSPSMICNVADVAVQQDPMSLIN